MAIYTGSTGSNPRRRTLALASGVIVLTVAATGIGVWRLAGTGHTPPAAAPHPVQVAAPPAASAPAPIGPALTTVAPHESASPALVLVATDSDLAATQKLIGDADAALAAGGLPALNDTVVAVDDAQAAQWAQTLAGENALRNALGLPEIEIVDLR